MSKDTLYSLTQTAGIYDTTTVTDELYTDVGASIFQLGTVKRLFLGGADVVIRTASGGGGTLLVEGVDYTIGEEDFDYTTLIGFHVYTGITIDSVPYQSGDLYITYKTYGSYTDPNTFVPTATITSHGFMGRSQCVKSGSVDASGYANFLSEVSTDVIQLAATSVPVVIAFANGFDAYGEKNFIAYIDADVSPAVWQGATFLASTGTNYLYAELDSTGTVLTYGYTLVAPEYEYATSGTTADSSYYVIPERKMYVYNSGWVNKIRVYLGEAVVAASHITSIRNYALNGECLSSLSDLPVDGNGGVEHSIGTKHFITKLYGVCITAEYGYVAGDHAQISVNAASGSETELFYSSTKNAISLIGRNSGVVTNWIARRADTRVVTVLTAANWKWQVYMCRFF